MSKNKENKILNILLVTIISANPIIFYLLLKNIFITLLVFFCVLISLCILNFYAHKNKWIFIYLLNFILIFSVFVHFEVLFKYGFSEFVINDLYSPKKNYYFNKPYLNQSLKDLEYNSEYKTNKQGFRIGSKVPPDKSINKCDWIFLGDSFTQGAQVSYDQLYTTVLNKYFPDKIILNLGMSGFGLPEEYLLFKDVVKKLSPRKVFLFLSPFNDFMNVQEKTLKLSDYLMHYSDLFRFLMYQKKFTTRNELPLKRWTVPFFEDESRNIDYNIFYKKSSSVKENDKYNFARYLEMLNKEVAEIDAELIVILLPTKEQLYYPYLKEVIENFEIDPSQVDLSIPNDFLKDLCAKNNILYFDLTYKYTNPSGRIFYEIDEHLNPYGHELTGEILAKELTKSFGISSNIKFLSKNFWGDRYPTILEDDKGIIYQALIDGNYEIILSDIALQQPQRLTSNNVDDFHPTISLKKNSILFTQGEQEKQQMKVWRKSLAGEELKLITPLENQFGAIPSFSRDGNSITYAEWYFDPENKTFTLPQIVVTDFEGNNKEYITSNKYENWRPIFSNDGKAIIYISLRNSNFDIFEFDLETKQEKQITHTQYDEWDPQFSPDGERIVFSAYKDSNWDLFEMNRDTLEVVQLTYSRGDEWDPNYSSSGAKIIFAGEFGFFGGMYEYIKQQENLQ